MFREKQPSDTEIPAIFWHICNEPFKNKRNLSKNLGNRTPVRTFDSCYMLLRFLNCGKLQFYLDSNGKYSSINVMFKITRQNVKHRSRNKGSWAPACDHTGAVFNCRWVVVHPLTLKENWTKSVWCHRHRKWLKLDSNGSNCSASTLRCVGSPSHGCQLVFIDSVASPVCFCSPWLLEEWFVLAPCVE